MQVRGVDMSVLSIPFLLFAAAVTIIYYILPHRFQWMCLLAANLLFCACAGIRGCLVLLAVAFITYLAGLFLGREKEHYSAEKGTLSALSGTQKREKKRALKEEHGRRNRMILAAGLIPVIAVWAFFKWNADHGSIVMPIAVSYYTFIAVSYAADVEAGKFAPERNFFRYLTFLSFFPQMTEGPFTRYDRQKEELFSGHSFSFQAMTEGILRMLYGYCKKIILADSLWAVLGALLDSEQVSGLSSAVLVLLLPLQQYADFSGCMDIVIGFSQILGIRLPENFRSPIFSKSIDEVWRRWHVTLGAFCKDYVFYPVALGKRLNETAKKISVRHPLTGKNLPVMVSLFCVWTVMGIWHGFGAKYLLWGWMNLFFIALNVLLGAQYKRWRECLHIRQGNREWSLFCMARTYILFGIFEMMSDGSAAGIGARRILSLVRPSAWSAEPLKAAFSSDGASYVCWPVCILLVILILVIDTAKEKKINVMDWMHRAPLPAKAALYVALFYLIVLFAPSGMNVLQGFGYARF
jgi:alginate O-acetyltransferase complex protein AlgI